MDINKQFIEILKYINFTDTENLPSVVKDDKRLIFQLIDLLLSPIKPHENFEDKVLFKNSGFTFNIFNLDAGFSIMEHDHPGQQGISFVLNGSCSVRTFTLLENKRHESYLSLESHRYYEAGDTFSHGYHQGNIHGIKSERGACLLTICQHRKSASLRYYYARIETTGNIVRAKRILMRK